MIVTGLSSDFEIEVRMLGNNPTGIERTNIEPVIGSQFSRLLRQQQDSKVLSASKGTATADRGEKTRKPHNRLEGSFFNCGRKYHRGEDCRSAKKIENQEMLPPTRRAEVGASFTSLGVRTPFRINTVACAEA